MARTYTVQTGDTLYLIARRFGTTVERLAQANNIADPDVIYVGQVLTIPDEEAPGVPVENRETKLIDGLLYTIYTDQTVYRQGEDVLITLIKKNVTNRNITLRYRSAQRYDFVVRRGPEQREVWRWSRGRFFAQVASDYTLVPGESQVFRVTWNQRDTLGRQVTPGTFTVEGANYAERFKDKGISTTIKIRLGAIVPTPTPLPTATPCPEINVLLNPGFENWPDPADVPIGWKGSNLYRTSLSHSGNFAAELGAIHNERAELSQTVEIEPGRIYNLIWWARENVQPGGVARYTVFVEIIYYNRGGQFAGRTEPRFSQENIPNNAYQQYRLSTGRVPEGARLADVRFIFEPSWTNNNTVKIDDVELRCLV